MHKKTASKQVIVPIGDRVLIKPFTEADLRKSDASKNKFEIILPESITREKSAQGKVIGVGSGKIVDGKRVLPEVHVGEIVVFSRYGYDEIELNGEEYYLIKEENILAIVK